MRLEDKTGVNNEESGLTAPKKVVVESSQNCADITRKISKALGKKVEDEARHKTEEYMMLSKEKELLEEKNRVLQSCLITDKEIIKIDQNSVRDLVKSINEKEKEVEHFRLEANTKLEEKEVLLEVMKLAQKESVIKEKKLEETKLEISRGVQNIDILDAQMKKLLEGENVNTSTTNRVVELLNQQIAAKCTDLECPVCTQQCTPPIYRCQADHMICKTCRLKIKGCPECRIPYWGLQIHRYAERDHQQMVQLEQELAGELQQA